MTSTATITWLDANQRYLSAAVAAVRAVLERHSARVNGSSKGAETDDEVHGELDATVRGMATPPALDMLCTTFRLTPFERNLLLLCAAVELDATIAPLCAAAQGDPLRAYPTFSLALAALPHPHWSALTPRAPLRRWRLIDVGTGSALTLSPLRIDEWVLHYLTGVPHLDERLAGIVELLVAKDDLVPSHRAVAERLVAVWSKAASGSSLPVVQLCGAEVAGKRAIAAAACAAVGLNLYVMCADVIPSNPGDLHALLRLWEREAALSAGTLLLDCHEVEPSDVARVNAIGWLIERTRGPLIVVNRDRWRTRQRPMIAVDVDRPDRHEQRDIWYAVMGAAASNLNGQVEALVSQFSLSAPTIRAAHAEAAGHLAQAGHRDIGGLLWDVCRVQARPRLDDLAQRIEPAATWDDLVLPEQQRQILRQIAVHVRQRVTVYEAWGFAARGSRGLGISALFTGASGTGKTMAAEVLANELRLDLYRIDLSAVVSKYIGETEKNLRQVFDAAEEGGAILLFDEADALFGKRSEVKDSHDRYANIEVSYLLQRMEAYRSLAILTTNLKNALDTAFLRRIRFVVQFPFPDTAQRAEIWRRIFPPTMPTEGLDVATLARLNVAGGNIRNIALNAAFLAADAREPVRMAHLLCAARTEYAKLEKPLTGTETEGWQ